MGVQDLNKLINSAEKVKSINRDYENIIIDASNLLFTLIYRSLSNLTSFDSIEFEKFTVKSNNRIPLQKLNLKICRNGIQLLRQETLRLFQTRIFIRKLTAE